MFDGDGALLYVGQSCWPGVRMGVHQNRSPWFREVSSITVEHFPSEQEARDAEVRAIRRERPRYNVQRFPRLVETAQ